MSAATAHWILFASLVLGAVSVVTAVAAVVAAFLDNGRTRIRRRPR